MSMNRQQREALFILYPNIAVLRDDIAYDAENNKIVYDLSSVETKVVQIETDRIAQEQAQATSKASALAKLAALGLTQDEVKALVG